MARIGNKIDVHHHVYAPAFTEALNRAGGDPSGWYIPPWTVELDHDIAQKMGIQTAILSATAPGPEIESDPVKAAQLARAINEFNANVRDAEPLRYGFFASVPSLLDTKLALQEIDYAFDTLKADGVVLMTRYGSDNHYLGHPDLTPIWDALNTRKAVVFVHPTHPVDTNLINKHLPQPGYDYPHETGRTAIDLITTNMLRDHASGCKIILSHAGGDLPYLVDRVAGLIPHAPPSFRIEKNANAILAEARSFYFDTALSSSDMALTALMALLGPENADHVLFGSDFPNAPTESVEYFTSQLERNGTIEVPTLRQNALKLFPRLR